MSINGFFTNVASLPFFIVGIVFYMTGLLLTKYPPSRNFAIYGYRTKSSLKSKERWDFAQTNCAMELKLHSLFLFIFALIGFILNIQEDLAHVVNILLIVAIVFRIYIRVEKKLSKKFGAS